MYECLSVCANIHVLMCEHASLCARTRLRLCVYECVVRALVVRACVCVRASACAHARDCVLCVCTYTGITARNPTQAVLNPGLFLKSTQLPHPTTPQAVHQSQTGQLSKKKKKKKKIQPLTKQTV